MWKLLWLLPVAVALGLVLPICPLNGQQPGDDFGVLRMSPPTSPTSSPTRPAVTGLPKGIEPISTSGSPPAHSAVPNRFPLTKDAGTWMVCAATYIGIEGADLAHQIATDLRDKHHLPVYIYNRGDEERRKLNEEHEALQKRYPGVKLRRRTYRIEDQYAVLVGGFKDFKDAGAGVAKIKALPVPKLTLPGGKNPYELMTYQDIGPDKKPVMKRALVSPYHHAMAVRNPLAPQETAAKPKWDPFWKTLNADEPYSLLKNSKAFTLVVKEYVGGARVLQNRKEESSSFLKMLGLGGQKAGDTLGASAMQAHELAKLLRNPKFGFTSYVLHTRTSSIVCVGGFDGPEDPELLRVQGQLKQLKFATKGGVDPIGLLPNPVPVEVPKF